MFSEDTFFIDINKEEDEFFNLSRNEYATDMLHSVKESFYRLSSSGMVKYTVSINGTDSSRLWSNEVIIDGELIVPFDYWNVMNVNEAGFLEFKFKELG